MTSRLQRFWLTHPTVRQALFWALPAILFALALRLCLLSYSPYAYWGSDSRSYFDFTYKLFTEHEFSLVEKRRLLYPIYVALVSFLPGSPLRWLAVFQHALGVLTLLPIAYIIRKTCTLWRWWIIPVTVIYAGMPVLLWYEHELLGETIMFSMAAWAFGGWVAWAGAEQRARAARLWWCFLIPFALVILTKPSARFFWPGIALGLLYLRAWQRVSPRGMIAAAALIAGTFLVGSSRQGAWLLYTATFPLTKLASPLRAEYKAEIAADVQKVRARVDHYYREDDWAFSFLENPSKQKERPLWTKLESQPDLKPKIYKELAMEGLLARPDLFLLLGRDRLVASANVSTFKETRFSSGYYPERFADDYRHAELQVASGKASYEAMALGLPRLGPLPPYGEIAQELAPKRDSRAEQFVVHWVEGFEHWSDLVQWPAGREKNLLVRDARPSPLGWYLLLSLTLPFATLRWRRSYGGWILGAISYLCGMFLCSQVNPRYFGASWPVLIPILALPLDLLLRLLWEAFAHRQAKFSTGRTSAVPAG